jgi:crotonobetainyl-CoA:carnitine CoA-transferase CaiB-like acyl-CoA transferase
MGVRELANDPRYLAMKDRNKNRSQLVADMEQVLTTQPTAFWLDTFASLGIPHAPINTYDQVFAHPQVQHRSLRVDMKRPPEQGGGNIAMVASPIRMSDTPVEYRHAPPVNGADSAKVLREVLNKSDAEVEALRQQKVV